MSKELVEKNERDEIPFTKKDRDILKSILQRYPDPMKELEGKENDSVSNA